MERTSISLNGQSKPIARPDSLNELQEMWRLLGFTQEQPVIVIVGGAGGMTDEGVANVKTFFEKYLAPFIQQKNAAVIDGGTDNGVMAAIGRARNLAKANFPLVGVVARDIDQVEDMLEPNHSQFIFCPGSHWGDESEWIAASASALTGSQLSVAILINGGQISWIDARFNIQYGRPVLIAEGSGRTADVIATTSTGSAYDPQAISLLQTRKVHIANFFKEPEKFIRKIDELLK